MENKNVNELKKVENKNNVASIVFAVFALVVAIIGVSVALWTWSFTGDANTLSTGSISLTMHESNDVISITNVMPMSDANGKTLAPDKAFDFAVTSVTTGGPGTMTYSINVTKVAVDSGNNAFANSNIKFYLTKLSGTSETQVLAPTLASTVMGDTGSTGTLATSLTHSHTSAGTVKTNYRFRMWVDFNTDASGWTASSKLQYKVKLGVSGTLA